MPIECPISVPRVVCAVMLLITAVAKGYDFYPPEPTVAQPEILQVLRSEIAQPDPAQAAIRLGGLLGAANDALIATPDGGVMSLATWVRALKPAERKALAPVCEAQYGGKAREALVAIRADPQATAEAFYAVAKRFPFTTAAGEALSFGADRALAEGDLPAAEALYDLAREAGATEDSPRHQAARRVGAALSSASALSHSVAFEARWYGQVDSFRFPRSIPVADRKTVFFASSGGVTALDDRGVVKWTWTPPGKPKNESKFEMDRQSDVGRGISTVPSLFLDTAGMAQIIVVYQRRGDNAEGCLRAFRASDGELLWDTRELFERERQRTRDKEIQPLLYLSDPAVRGRSVYAVAVNAKPPGEPTPQLVLAVHDVMTGRLLRVTALGALSDRSEAKRGAARHAKKQLDYFWQQTAPLVFGESVLIAPGVESVISVGRFDGAIQWIRPYPRLTDSPDRDLWRRFWERKGGQAARSPMHLTPLLRYASTPVISDGLAVVAPMDSQDAFGLDPLTGLSAWDTSRIGEPTLIGAVEGLAIFAGAGVVAVESASGDAKWKWQPSRGNVTGPAALMSGVVVVPTTTGLVALNPKDGSVLAKPPASVPDLRRLTSGGGARTALKSIDALDALGAPAAAPVAIPLDGPPREAGKNK